MRISDWSSDVCSSDLLDQAIGGYTALEKDFAETVELIAMAEEDGDQDMVAEGERALRDLADRTQKKQLESLLSGEADGNDCYQIGRASCRERVCQYV